MTLRVAVIIPFYQTRPGLLGRAVKSALEQNGACVLVIVVDDGSPIPAQTELTGADDRVVVIQQENAGPGAARNRGLQAVPDGIGYIAFLDSDDRWTGEHLRRAVAALEAGADFYFSDYVPLGAERSTFALCDFPDRATEAVGDDVYAYPCDLFGALLRRSPVGTSTVVYRRAIAARGFPTGFSYAEDVFYWMHLVRRSRLVVFSTRCEAVYGAGVNIAASAQWGNPAVLRKLHSEYRFHQAVLAAFALTPEQDAWSRDYRGEVFRSFRANLLHLAIRGARIDWRQALEVFALEAKRRISRGKWVRSSADG